MNDAKYRASAVFCFLVILGCATAVHASASLSTAVICLDGVWRLAIDPANEGVDRHWFQTPHADAKPTKVPWIIQDAFPGYHGVAWYWRDFLAPSSPHDRGRYLLRFWAVDYKADVWLNGVPIGNHEGGETPFVLDVTESIKPGLINQLSVRVVNPTLTPIDGLVLAETPHRNKVIPYTAGSSYNHGGIVDSVELLITPALYIESLCVWPDPASGIVRVTLRVQNGTPSDVSGELEFTLAPAPTGPTEDVRSVVQSFAPGTTLSETELNAPNYRLWELNEPNLYRVTARVREHSSPSFDEQSTRCGFRDFRFDNGYFRLNGKRLFLRCSHTGNHCPVGLQLPPDPDMLRRDLLNVKVMGFNAIRFIAGVAARYQLDLCDEIGLLVYEEHYGSWLLADSPRMNERYDRALREMILRDRNHASVVIWGLLNETADGPVFRHAAASLPVIRRLDDTRMVMLNSGRWDRHGMGLLDGLQAWCTSGDPDPNVTHNAVKRPLTGLGITWQPGQLALHPGPKREYSVVRWTAADNGVHSIEAVFAGIAQSATTDVHVLHNGRSIHDALINVSGQGNESPFSQKVVLARGDNIDFVVGVGNGFYGGDTTALAARIESASGQAYDAAGDFSVSANPNGPWEYGYLAPGPTPSVNTLATYRVGKTHGDEQGIGSLSNPGTADWQDVLSDQHPYQRVPHTASVIRFLRSVNGGNNPVFVSEYGVGSAVDLWRVTRHYERLGKEHVEDARFYRDKLEHFLLDWDRWKMADCFATPQDFFAQSIRQMAAERLYGLNALRKPKPGGSQSDGNGRSGNEWRRSLHNVPRTEARHNGCSLERLGSPASVFVRGARQRNKGDAGQVGSGSGQRRRVASGRLPHASAGDRNRHAAGLRTRCSGDDSRTSTRRPNHPGRLSFSPKTSCSMFRRAPISLSRPWNAAAPRPAEKRSSSWTIQPKCRKSWLKSFSGVTTPG